MKNQAPVSKSQIRKVKAKINLKSTRFEPGQPVERSGVYEAFHALHRVTHRVTLIAGQQFPLCSRCRDRVRFKLLRSKPSLNTSNSPLVHVIGVFLPEAA